MTFLPKTSRERQTRVFSVFPHKHQRTQLCVLTSTKALFSPQVFSLCKFFTFPGIAEFSARVIINTKATMNELIHRRSKCIIGLPSFQLPIPDFGCAFSSQISLSTVFHPMFIPYREESCVHKPPAVHGCLLLSSAQMVCGTIPDPILQSREAS